jgi:hypothetical protein
MKPRMRQQQYAAVEDFSAVVTKLHSSSGHLLSVSAGCPFHFRRPGRWGIEDLAATSVEEVWGLHDRCRGQSTGQIASDE